MPRIRQHPAPRIRLLSRTGCHLCEEALADLEAILADYPDASLEVIDIDRDDELQLLHMERIPVVEIESREVCVTFFEEDAVREALGAGEVRWGR